jgi:hypothetical protein
VDVIVVRPEPLIELSDPIVFDAPPPPTVIVYVVPVAINERSSADELAPEFSPMTLDL